MISPPFLVESLPLWLFQGTKTRQCQNVKRKKANTKSKSNEEIRRLMEILFKERPNVGNNYATSNIERE